jgi:small neutral amino acid transporter SnatA (MarC family)
MIKRLIGFFLIALAVSIFYPPIFSKIAFKIIVSLFLIWFGLRLLFSKGSEGKVQMVQNDKRD